MLLIIILIFIFYFFFGFRYTNVQLELITDPDMYLMLETGIRGGVSVVTHKHAKANNKYLESEYDPNKPISRCIYLDANNLYGWAMSQKMPFGNLRFLTSTEIEELNINELKDDVDTGYIFEVDLDYPEHLHYLHNDLPVAPVSSTKSSLERAISIH